MPRLLALLLVAGTFWATACDDDSGNGGAGDSASCHPSYEGECLDPDASDYDCEGGSGDGPKYTGAVTVNGPDDFELDRDGDGSACE